MCPRLRAVQMTLPTSREDISYSILIKCKELKKLLDPYQGFYVLHSAEVLIVAH